MFGILTDDQFIVEMEKQQPQKAENHEPSTECSTERRGRFKLTPQKFTRGDKKWQIGMTIGDRMYNIQKILNSFYCTKNGARHHRLPELMWFSRKMEEIFYERAAVKKFYDDGIDSMIETMQEAIQSDPHLAELHKANEIPSTDHLEKLFTLKAPRGKYVEEDYMADGAVEVKLISDDRFRHHTLSIEPQLNLPTLYAEQKKKQMRRGPNNRRIVLARYANRERTEEQTMTFTVTPCESSKNDKSV